MMSRSIMYQVKAIPDGTMNNQRIEDAVDSIRLAFEKLMEIFSSVARPEESYLRLAFMSGQGRKVDVYFVIYGLTEPFAEQIINEIKQKNYILERVDFPQQQEIWLQQKNAIAGDTMAIVKSEKAIMSPYSALGYYYYTSVLERENGVPADNFSAMLKSLENCPDSMVLLDLIATRETPQEDYVFRDMKQALERIMQGYMYGNQMIQDPAAREAYPCFAHFADNDGRAMFKYNILVASAAGYAPIVASQMLSSLKTTCKGNCELEILQIREAGMFPDMEEFPLRINDHLMIQYRNAMIWNGMMRPDNLYRLPYLMTGREAGNYFRLPVGDGSISSIKVTTVKFQGELLKDEVTDEGNIIFGTLKEDSEISIGAPLKAFTKHCMIVGMPGCGKTTFSVNLLLQFYDKGIPFLAIEPTKTEYRALIDRVPGLQFFTPGNNRVSPFVINPFIPPKGITVEQYIPSLSTAFQAAFSMPSPLDSAFTKAIKTTYLRYGWKDYSKSGDEDVIVFGMHEFILVFKDVIQRMNYGKEVKGNLESGGKLRLTSLLEQNRNIYDTVHTIPLEDFLTKPTVLELNAIENAEQKALIMALLLINICLYTKVNHSGDGELKNIILMDEAHVLLDGSGTTMNGVADSKATTVKAMQNMIKEIRSLGTGIILADQTPSCVGTDIIANTDIKIAFRLVQSYEKGLIADSTNMSETDCNNLSKLQVGEAYAYYNKMDYPKYIATEDIRNRENIRLKVENEEILKRMTYWQDKKELLKPFAECRYCTACSEGCNLVIRADAEYIAEKALEEYGDLLKNETNARNSVWGLAKLMKNYLAKYDEETKKVLVPCAQIRYNRKLQLETEWAVEQKLLAQWIKRGYKEEQ